MLQAIRRRQYEPYCYGLKAQLLYALHWWLANLHLALPRAVFLPSRQLPLVITYSHGEGVDAGGIAAGCRQRIGDIPFAGFLEVPFEVRQLWPKQRASFVDNGDLNDVAEIEAIGFLWILHTWPWLLRDA